MEQENRKNHDKNKETNFVSAVLYLGSQEVENVTSFLEMLYRVLDGYFWNYEIICVNDGVGRDMLRQVREFKEGREVPVTIINMGARQGLEAGMCAGVDLAIGDYVFEFDSAYVDYDELLIVRAYMECMAGHDIISVRVPESEWGLAARVFYRVYNRYSHTEYGLGTERFCIVSRRAVNRASAYGSMVLYRKAVYAASGLGIAGIGYEPTKKNINRHRAGMGKAGTAMDAMILFTDAAYRVSLLLTAIMAAAMLGFGAYTVASYLTNDKVVAGWTSMMGLVSLGFLGISALMAAMFKYLEVIVRLVFQKKEYTVQSVEKLG